MTIWIQIPDHPYRILIIGGSGSRKTKSLLNLIKQQDDDDYSIVDKIYLNVKDLMKQNINIFLLFSSHSLISKDSIYQNLVFAHPFEFNFF